MVQLFAAKCTSTARLDGKTAIITGGNTGIGKCCAEDFYKRGARVIIACRSLEKANSAVLDIKTKCEKLPNLGFLNVMELDLNSLESVRKFAEKILTEEEHIHILLNNAGVMFCPAGKTKDGFETHMGTNHFGHFLLTLLLLPKIISSAPARVVNVSSLAHELARSGMDFEDINWEKRSYDSRIAYFQSKLANVLFTKELARRLTDANITGVTTYSLHPGVIATELSRHLHTAIVPGATWFFNNIMNYFIKTPHQGAQTSIYCSVDEKAGKETGLYYDECKVKQPSRKARNVEDAKRLWEISCKLVGLEDYDPFAEKDKSSNSRL